MSNYASVFDHHLHKLVAEACREWGENPPDETYYEHIRERLGQTTAEWIGVGLETGLITEDACHYRLGSCAGNRRSQQWITRERSNGGPGCSWNHLAQAACYVRLWKPCSEYGLEIRYKDGPIDLTVARDGEILWCLEAGEKLTDLKPHLNDVVKCARTLSRDAGTPLDLIRQKAGYIVERQPQFLSCVALDGQQDFWVKRETKGFSLVESDPPIYLATDPSALSPQVVEQAV